MPGDKFDALNEHVRRALLTGMAYTRVSVLHNSVVCEPIDWVDLYKTDEQKVWEAG